MALYADGILVLVEREWVYQHIGHCWIRLYSIRRRTKKGLFVRQQNPLSKANIIALLIWFVTMIIFCLLIADIGLN